MTSTLDIKMRLTELIIKNKFLDLTILIILIFAFSVGGYNHISDVINKGIFPYSNWVGVPQVINIFWTSLTILDFIVVALLIFNIRIGYILGFCIMIIDVPVNIFATAYYLPIPFLKNYGLLLQTIVLLLLLFTMHRIGRLTKTNKNLTNHCT
jgi:hypothetical protein